MNDHECPPSHFLAQWVAAESVDSNLSKINTGMFNEITGTSEVRFVPKLSNVTGLSSSSTVLCTTNPVVIIGIVVGNINLASV